MNRGNSMSIVPVLLSVRSLAGRGVERNAMADRKLECNRCGGQMRVCASGVRMIGGGPGPTPIVKLRCDECDITRFEQRTDIDAELTESATRGTEGKRWWQFGR